MDWLDVSTDVPRDPTGGSDLPRKSEKDAGLKTTKSSGPSNRCRSAGPQAGVLKTGGKTREDGSTCSSNTPSHQSSSPGKTPEDLMFKPRQEASKKIDDPGKGRIDVKNLENYQVESLVKVFKSKLPSADVVEKFPLRDALKESEEDLKSAKSELEKRSIENKSLLKQNEDQKVELKEKDEKNIKLQAELKEVKDQNEVKIKSLEKTSSKEEIGRIRDEKEKLSKQCEVLKASLEKTTEEKKANKEAGQDLERKVKELTAEMQEAQEKLKCLEEELELGKTREEKAKRKVEKELKQLKDQLHHLKKRRRVLPTS